MSTVETKLQQLPQALHVQHIGTVQMFRDFPETMTMPQVAVALGIGKSKAYDLAKSPDFPAYNIGRRVVISKQALIAWVRQQGTPEVKQARQRDRY